MKVLDLFSGLGGWSKAFRKRGHFVQTLDIERRFKPDFCMDILELEHIEDLGEYDVILASPPCQTFSVAAFPMHYWKKEGDKYVPNSKKAHIAKDVAARTFMLLRTSSARYWVIENPRGLMRKVFIPPVATVAYCQYGSKYMKPTDLWGRIPPSFKARMCEPKRRDAAWWKTKEEKRRVDSPQDCSHAEAPRGSRTGTQGPKTWKYGMLAYRTSGREAAIRSLVPYGLSLEMCLAAERDLGVGR